jgi:hypothetical protein
MRSVDSRAPIGLDSRSMSLNSAARCALLLLVLAVVCGCGVVARDADQAQFLPADDADFKSRCASDAVVLCVGFDGHADIPSATDGARFGVFPSASDPTVAPTLDPMVRASGAGSLKFTIPSNSAADTSGSYFANFSKDLSVQFGERQHFFVQWRQRFSRHFLENRYRAVGGPGGWKQAIVGSGDQPQKRYYSCSDLEVVVNNGYQRGFPQMYNSCNGSSSHGAYDGFQEPFGPSDFRLQNARSSSYCLSSQGVSNPPAFFPPSGNCFGYAPEEWMTFQIGFEIGRRVGDEFRDSFVRLWVARENQPSELVILWGPYNLSAGSPAEDQRFGKVWLLPYNTDKDPRPTYTVAYTWYDELIVSRERIPDPVGTPERAIPVDATGTAD